MPADVRIAALPVNTRDAYQAILQEKGTEAAECFLEGYLVGAELGFYSGRIERAHRKITLLREMLGTKPSPSDIELCLDLVREEVATLCQELGERVGDGDDDNE